MLELPQNALVVFVSDSHIGGDPGCDGFESPTELRELFEELAAHEGPVELILAGDFFDFLQIGEVPKGTDRASLTVSRPEYESMFAALRSFREEGKRVIYLPGNHDAEGWWNPEIQETLKDRGLIVSARIRRPQPATDPGPSAGRPSRFPGNWNSSEGPVPGRADDAMMASLRKRPGPGHSDCHSGPGDLRASPPYTSGSARTRWA